MICGKILKFWRSKKLPLIHVRHSSIFLDSKLHESKKGFEFNDYVTPLENEIILTKNVNSAFIGTNLKSIIDEQNISKVVIIGMTTNHCISSTVRMSSNYGYETYLVSDSTACFNTVGMNGKIIDCDDIYKISIANLNSEFAQIISSEDLFRNIN
mgnify:CR=1 FL=1